MDNYKVSFIVPVYNVEKYIAECLDSLINQTIDSKEIVIVNDGSIDSSMDVVEPYLNKYDFIQVIHQENKGLSEARNTGLRKANGKYVQFIDSDDFVDKDYALAFYHICEENNLDILRGQYRKYIEEHEQYLELKQVKNKTDIVMSTRNYFNESIENQTYEVTAILGFYKRDFLLRNELFFLPNVTMEDHEFTLKCLTKDQNSKCMEVLNPFYTYRIRPRSITTTFNPKNIKDILKNIEEMQKYVENQNLDDELRKNCYKAISTLFYHATSIYGRLTKEERKEVKPLFNKDLIRFSEKYAYTKHQRIKFIISYFFWPLIDVIYSIKIKKN
jgi:glycosyltransferase involved in cell wall biosynthesis